MSELGKLVQVDLRKVWEHEARDFSAWLVKPENLSLLSEQLGIEIEPIDTEASIGRFRIDILAKEAMRLPLRPMAKDFFSWLLSS